MILNKVLPFTKELLKKALNEDSIVIDCTTGNGNDTLYLTTLVPKGFVYGFDVQEQAIQNTRILLEKNNVNLNQVKLILDSHSKLDEYLKEEHRQNISAAIFNLGYLPRSDKSITTKSDSTILAIQQVLYHLQPHGLCIVVIYPGHDEGKIESNDVFRFSKSINQQEFSVLKYEFINQDNNPPYVIAIERK